MKRLWNTWCEQSPFQKAQQRNAKTETGIEQQCTFPALIRGRNYRENHFTYLINL